MNTNIYLIKALDNYPYDLEACLESLNYAISFDDNNPIALCLIARVNMEIFKDYATANQYFRDAVVANTEYVETYGYFLECLMCQKEYEEVLRLIAFARKQKGIDLARMFYYEGLVFEAKQEFKKALKAIRNSMLNTNLCSFMTDLEEVKDRIEKKKELLKKKLA